MYGLAVAVYADKWKAEFHVSYSIAKRHYCKIEMSTLLSVLTKSILSL
jgi:hypothetical protein